MNYYSILICSINNIACNLLPQFYWLDKAYLFLQCGHKGLLSTTKKIFKLATKLIHTKMKILSSHHLHVAPNLFFHLWSTKGDYQRITTSILIWSSHKAIAQYGFRNITHYLYSDFHFSRWSLWHRNFSSCVPH